MHTSYQDKRRNVVARTHNESYKNEYSIVPTSYTESGREQFLAGALSDFGNAIFIDCEPALELQETIPNTRIHTVTVDELFPPGDTPSEFDVAMRDFVALNRNGTSTRLDAYEESYKEVLRYGGRKIRHTINRLTDVLNRHRFPQSIACVGPHVCIAAWLRSVMASQRQMSHERDAFTRVIDSIGIYLPENGVLKYSTSARHQNGRFLFQLTGSF